ncbi:MAG: hypothetical protein JXR71_00845 [Bacteroidales bacterium]|nr:hypothetical protein [Bacteroidales bacterium]
MKLSYFCNRIDQVSDTFLRGGFFRFGNPGAGYVQSDHKHLHAWEPVYSQKKQKEERHGIPTVNHCSFPVGKGQ